MGNGRNLPVLRFNKVFNIARDLKVFLSLQSGATWGAVPDVESIREQRRIKKQAEKLSKTRQLIREQKRKNRNKDRTILKLENKLHRVVELENKLHHKEIFHPNNSPLAKGVMNESVHKEIFRLKNEFRAKEWKAAGESEPKTLPDFVIIGAQKCGTTFLYNLLSQHPCVERAFAKELHYFDIHFKKGIEWYRSQFLLPRRKEERKITGENSPNYLFHQYAARRMAKVVPQARLIVLLRNPIDRAYSHYQHNIARKGRETLEFEEAIEAEEVRLRGEKEKMLEDEQYVSFNYRRFSYLLKGIYVDHLLHWSKFFSDEQMLVLKSEDFYEQPAETLKLIQGFLHLPNWEPEPSVLSLLFKRQNRYSQMNPVTRRRLEEYFEPHNRRLYEYLGRDFGW